MHLLAALRVLLACAKAGMFIRLHIKRCQGRWGFPFIKHGVSYNPACLSLPPLRPPRELVGSKVINAALTGYHGGVEATGNLT